MMAIQHQELAGGRWHQMSLAEQFGNVGSEISRAAKWTTRNPALARGALERALELIDLMLDDPRHRQCGAPLIRFEGRAAPERCGVFEKRVVRCWPQAARSRALRMNGPSDALPQIRPAAHYTLLENAFKA